MLEAVVLLFMEVLRLKSPPQGVLEEHSGTLEFLNSRREKIETTVLYMESSTEQGAGLDALQDPFQPLRPYDSVQEG